MSYSIHVYPVELLQKTIELELSFSHIQDYLEQEEDLIPFSGKQVALIKEHLEKRGYTLKNESSERKNYVHKKYPTIYVMQTFNGLYFIASGEDIVEISLTAGEFRHFPELKGNFAVFDPQNNGWQL